MLEIQTKKCSKCGVVKPLTEFHKKGKSAAGIQKYNSSCRTCRSSSEAKQNRKVSDSKYRSKPEVVLSRKTSNAKYHIERYADPCFRSVKKFNSNKNRAIRYGAPYSPAIGEQYFINKQIIGNVCAYCGVSLEETTEHFEHMIPLSRGGTHTPDNVVCACERCNLSKGAKTVEEWYPEQPFYSVARMQLIRDMQSYWETQVYEVLVPTAEQIAEAMDVAADVQETLQSLSRVNREAATIVAHI